jgi:hypothetical protein
MRNLYNKNCCIASHKSTFFCSSCPSTGAINIVSENFNDSESKGASLDRKFPSGFAIYNTTPYKNQEI